MFLVPADRASDAWLVTWDDVKNAPDIGGLKPDDPKVVLRLLEQRGIRLDGLPESKVRLRLRLCVRQEFLSLKQAVAVREHLLGE